MATCPLNLADRDHPGDAFVYSGILGGVIAGFITLDNARSSVPLRTVVRACAGGFLYGGIISGVGVTVWNATESWFGPSFIARFARAFFCGLIALAAAETVPPLIGLSVTADIGSLIFESIWLISLFLKLTRHLR